ncbi:unnamed protein product [Protopolystoma xenopodis]|uniref:Uncharacterized protein n=1 Tax=Protopolystoma xenopodis TaxID=117903 RepID=A0A448XHN0_9PLAT|nr:unnamed protein product [Protopolystoma xenopodis]
MTGLQKSSEEPSDPNVKSLFHNPLSISSSSVCRQPCKNECLLVGLNTAWLAVGLADSRSPVQKRRLYISHASAACRVSQSTLGQCVSGLACTGGDMCSPGVRDFRNGSRPLTAVSYPQDKSQSAATVLFVGPFDCY